MRTSCPVEVLRQQAGAGSSSGSAPIGILATGTHLVLLDLERHVVTELVDADKRVVEGAHAVLAQGEIDQSHASRGSLRQRHDWVSASEHRLLYLLSQVGGCWRQDGSECQCYLLRTLGLVSQSRKRAGRTGSWMSRLPRSVLLRAAKPWRRGRESSIEMNMSLRVCLNDAILMVIFAILQSRG